MKVGRELGAAVKKQDLEGAKTKLAETRTSLIALQNEYKKILPLKYIPLLGAYVSDGDHAIKAGFAGLEAGESAIVALEPNADLSFFVERIPSNPELEQLSVVRRERQSVSIRLRVDDPELAKDGAVCVGPQCRQAPKDGGRSEHFRRHADLQDRQEFQVRQ